LFRTNDKVKLETGKSSDRRIEIVEGGNQRGEGRKPKGERKKKKVPGGKRENQVEGKASLDGKNRNRYKSAAVLRKGP